VHSAELARLADVTVRALRHYHQVGVLVEPERSSNGYRDYDVHDLIRVLRIKRLASLGIPLERMPDLLDDTGDRAGDETDGGAGELLDELDAELAGQIDRLTRQRALIAHLRAYGAAPDLPPELAPFLTVFAGASMPPELARFDRDQSVLLAHLAGEEGLPHLARFYESLTDSDLVPRVTAISESFGRLGPDSTEAEITDLIERFTATFVPMIEAFAASDPQIDLSGSADILNEYTSDLLNDQQRQVLEHLIRSLGQSYEA